jgi:geranylgeranyl pyrophosphate synthase
MDIPHGKLTSVLLELRRITEPDERRPVEAIVGRSDVLPRELDVAHRCLRDSGVVERLETRITALRTQAARTLDEAGFNPQGRAMLTKLADKLTIRRA